MAKQEFLYLNSRDELLRLDINKIVYFEGEGNYTYIVKCSDETLYTGWTNNLKKRLEAHNSGKGAKYTKNRRPVELVYFEEYDTKQEAMKREYAIKQLPREKKLALIRCCQSIF